MGGPLGESAGERLVAAAADGDLNDGTSRRTASLGVLDLVRLVRVGVGIVVVLALAIELIGLVGVVNAANQNQLRACGGPAGAALAQEFPVHPASVVRPEAVLERVLELLEGEVLGTTGIGPVEEGAMPPGTTTSAAR